MTLEELEALLGITVKGTAQEARYTALLAAAIDHVNGQCGDSFTQTDGSVVIPLGVQMGVALVVKSMTENQNVASQSLGDMSKSFFKGGTYESARAYWKKYKRVFFT
jgi:hypothetical protein